MKTEEHDIQAAAIKILKKDPRLKWVHAVPNGGARDAATGRRMKAEGVTPGVWDLHFPYPCFDERGSSIQLGLMIEVKYGKNSLTKEQAEYGIHCAEHGYAIAVCRSAQQIVDTVIRYVDGLHDNADAFDECNERLLR